MCCWTVSKVGGHGSFADEASNAGVRQCKVFFPWLELCIQEPEREPNCFEATAAGSTRCATRMALLVEDIRGWWGFVCLQCSHIMFILTVISRRTYCNLQQWVFADFEGRPQVDPSISCVCLLWCVWLDANVIQVTGRTGINNGALVQFLFCLVTEFLQLAW